MENPKIETQQPELTAWDIRMLKNVAARAVLSTQIIIKKDAAESIRETVAALEQELRRINQLPVMQENTNQPKHWKGRE